MAKTIRFTGMKVKRSFLKTKIILTMDNPGFLIGYKGETINHVRDRIRHKYGSRFDIVLKQTSQYVDFLTPKTFEEIEEMMI